MPTTVGNPTYQVQKALAGLGFPPGPLDGIPGARTTQAVRNYQMSRKLAPDGIVGPKTLAALQRDGYRIVSLQLAETGYLAHRANVGTPLTPWMDIARANLGVAEIVGPKHSPIIMGWIQELGAKVLGIDVKDDETPWCGTFAAMCISRSLPNEALPAIVVRASSWSKFGVPLVKPSPGAVMVYTRDGGGHVGFYVGEDATHDHIIGGNQSNKVSQMRIAKSRRAPVDAIRWPKTVPLPTVGPVILTASGAISRNEA